jgi:uncharacterized protein with ATP-grasp and redox domains
MITSLDCVPCFARQALDAARAASADPLLHERILRDVLGMIAAGDLNQPPPAFAQRMHRRLRELTGVPDPYRAEKDHSNHLALELLPDLSARISTAADPFKPAVRFAAAGNIIDLAAKTGISECDIKSAIESAVTEPFVGDLSSFHAATAAASSILYLTDNAGEIVFDRLLIEQLPAGRVTVVVRGAPVINDATKADAEAAGLDQIAEIIDNGSDAPGTVLEDCSTEFRKRFESADVIIAKGQGNYETLSNTHRSIFFLLKIKCPVVALRTGIAVGTQALIHIGPEGGTGQSGE